MGAELVLAVPRCCEDGYGAPGGVCARCEADNTALAGACEEGEGVVTFEELLRDTGEWADINLPNEDVVGKLTHLKEEVDEVLATPDDVEEWADCFMLLYDALRKQGLPFREVQTAMERKLEKNRLRVWEETSPGVYHHVKEVTS